MTLVALNCYVYVLSAQRVPEKRDDSRSCCLLALGRASRPRLVAQADRTGLAAVAV